MRKTIPITLLMTLSLVAVHPVGAETANTRGVENRSYSGLAYVFSGIFGQFLPTSMSYTDTHAYLSFEDLPPLEAEYQQSSLLGLLTFWTADFSLPGTPPLIFGGLSILGINTFLAFGTGGGFFLGLMFLTG